MNTANFVSIPASMLPEQEIMVFGGRRIGYGDLLGRIRRLAGSLKKLGLLAAEKLDHQEAKVKISKEQARKSQNDLRDSLQ